MSLCSAILLIFLINGLCSSICLHTVCCHHWIICPPLHVLVLGQPNSISNLMIIWCVVTGLWTLCQSSANSDSHSLDGRLRITNIMSDSTDDGGQTGADWRWLCLTYCGSVHEWVGCEWCHCLMMLMSLFFFFFVCFFFQRRRLSSCLGVSEHPLVELLQSFCLFLTINFSR